MKDKYGLSNAQIRDVFSAYEENYIRDKMMIIETSPSYLKGTIKNMAKYLISAMKDNYQTVKSAKIKEIKLLKESNSKFNFTVDESYTRFVNKEIIKKLKRMRGRPKVLLLSDFEKYILKGLFHDLYKHEGLKNILIQDQFCRFIKEKKMEFIEKILSYSEFLTRAEVLTEPKDKGVASPMALSL